MKKISLFAVVVAFALALLAGCSASVETTSTTMEIDEAAKTVTLNATTNGTPAENSIHFLVNKDGSNAENAYFTTGVTARELYDALEEIGGEHGDNIALDDTEGTIEGSDLDIKVIVDGNEYTVEELVAGSEDRVAQPRFGGNIDANEEVGTGCLFCRESCSLGIMSDAAYQYCEPAEFAATDKMPEGGTEVTIVITLK